MKKLIAISLMAATILLSACNKESELIERGTPTEKEPILDTYNLKTENPGIFFEKTATLNAKSNSLVSSEIAGRITKINIKSGQTVKKGDILITLGNSLSTDIQAEQNAAAEQGLYLSYESEYLTHELGENTLDSLEIVIDTAKRNLIEAKKALKNATEETKEQAKQAREMAEKQYDSAINQYKQAQISQEMQLIQVQNQINQAELNKRIAQLSAEKKYVRAPISGVITSLSAEEGNLTGPGQPIAQISAINSQIVKIGLNSEEYTYIRLGDRVTIESKSNTTKGTITSLTPTLDPMTQKHLVEISVNKNALTNGDIIKVVFKANTNKLFIPLNSILLEDGKKTVEILKNNKAEKVDVETGTIFSNYIEILRGLNGTEQLVVSYDNN